ncbi:WAP four-disulfide core domain protein 2-like [Saccostrea echinata]|uniref:WAP four-disulfide core domain protein 2-like n=1 Tax=Saccostrea echinata TaxID=191078 RepID=UPI002A804410|nr:WAP four-disulfide core domain protein 2-like [Saccostrea echinata]
MLVHLENVCKKTPETYQTSGPVMFKALLIMGTLQGFFIFLGACVVYAGRLHGFPGEKPGRCPRDDRITTCDCPIGQTQCTRDSDCSYDLKCCSFGCGCRTSCVKPVYGPGPNSGGCFYNGRYYSVGESFPATDGCNTCFCSDNGQVGCTLIGCH